MKRERIISIYLTEEEKERLKSVSKFLSLPLASFVRSSAIEKCNSIEGDSV